MVASAWVSRPYRTRDGSRVAYLPPLSLDTLPVCSTQSHGFGDISLPFFTSSDSEQVLFSVWRAWPPFCYSMFLPWVTE